MQSSTVAKSVAEEIIRAIREFRLLPGQRLVESDLTRDLGVSRTPLREALAHLSALGIVQIEPHRGASIPILDAGEVIGMMAVREVLEGLAARLAALSTDRAARNNLARIVKAFPEDGHLEIGTNAEFHNAIMRMSGNAQLIAVLEPLYIREFFLRSFQHPIDLKREHAQTIQHRNIARMILEKNPDEAERQARIHVSDHGALLRTVRTVPGEPLARIS